MTAATRTIQLSGVSINGGGNCQFSVTVTGSTEGVLNNVTQNVTSTNGGQGNTATDSVTVINPPALTKSFTPNQIPLGSTSALQFTLSNPNAGLTLNTLAFGDSLPAGVTAPDTPATTVCTDGSYSISANVISFNKPSLSAGANCQFSVSVTGATAGSKTNTTTTVSTTNSNDGAAATANLIIDNLTIAGTVNYAVTPLNQTQKTVAGVLMSASGTGSTSDTTDVNGLYEIAIQTYGGQYTVTPSKTGNINGITAFDATLVLRRIAAAGQGANALSGVPQMAADTDGDNQITVRYKFSDS